MKIDPIFSKQPSPKPSDTQDGESAKAKSRALVTRVGAEWGLGRISHKLRGFFNYAYDSSGCSGTHIYIIDSGIKKSHQEFNGRAYYGGNFVSGTPVSKLEFMILLVDPQSTN